MDLSLFVAQLVAIVYLAVGVGILVDKKYFIKMVEGFMKDVSAMYLGGLMAIIAGFSLVTFHNEWVKSWEVLVTIIGWMALVKGVMLLAFPSTMINMTKSLVNAKNLSTFAPIVIALGLVFGYFGFIA